MTQIKIQEAYEIIDISFYRNCLDSKPYSLALEIFSPYEFPTDKVVDSVEKNIKRYVQARHSVSR
jgi:hypothetical protein